jgi:P3 major capsid protein
MANTPQQSTQSALQLYQQQQAQNSAARAALLAQAIMMKQPIYSITSTPSLTPIVTVSPRFVGLGLGWWVEVIATFTNSGSTAATPSTSFSAANVLSQIQFNDLSAQTRIQTTGWHLETINTAKSKRVYGNATVATTGFDTPIPYGSNYNVISMTPSISGSGGTGTVRMIYWVPLSYTDRDLRGSIWLGVNNATAQLLLTLNPTPFVVNTADTTNAVYTGASTAAAALTSYTINVTQVYYDQVPFGAQGPALPAQDISTVYQLLNTAFPNVTQAIDFGMGLTNYRQFLSQVAIYNNNGTTGRANNDVNYWALQSANFTNVWKLTDSLVALNTRNILGADTPLGVRYFPSRQKPLATNQYGNLQLIINASSASAGAIVQIGYEFFAMIQTITQAGSIGPNA